MSNHTSLTSLITAAAGDDEAAAGTAITQLFARAGMRLGRASIYGIAAYALSFSQPPFVATTPLTVAILFLGLANSTRRLAEGLLFGLCILAFIRPELVSYLKQFAL